MGWKAGEVGKLKVIGREDVTFGLGQDEARGDALVLIEDGTLILAEDAGRVPPLTLQLSSQRMMQCWTNRRQRFN